MCCPFEHSFSMDLGAVIGSVVLNATNKQFISKTHKEIWIRTTPHKGTVWSSTSSFVSFIWIYNSFSFMSKVVTIHIFLFKISTWRASTCCTKINAFMIQTLILTNAYLSTKHTYPKETIWEKSTNFTLRTRKIFIVAPKIVRGGLNYGPWSRPM